MTCGHELFSPGYPDAAGALAPRIVTGISPGRGTTLSQLQSSRLAADVLAPVGYRGVDLVVDRYVPTQGTT